MGNIFQTRMNIRYKGQDLSFFALVNRENGDLIQLEQVISKEKQKGKEVNKVKPIGSVWCPNRDLARRTEHDTQYQCYERGMYDRMRGGWHIGQRYGIRDSKPGTEAQELARDREVVRDIVVRLLSSSTSLAERQLWLIGEMLPLIDEYLSKYDTRKVMALQDMSRGTILEDALKRLNVGASAMALGAAIGNLIEREKAILYIDARMSQRAQVTSKQISLIRDSYRVLWSGFHPAAALKWAFEDAGRLPPKIESPGWLEMIEKKGDWPEIIQGLELRRPSVESIRALPFCRMAVHATEDIDASIEYLKSGQEMRARGSLTRLREGLRLFFALDYLQMRIITPLTLLEYDLKLEHDASAVPGSKRQKFVLRSSLAKSAFEAIEGTFVIWDGKLAKCKDGILKGGVKNRIAGHIDRVYSSIAKDNWPNAKEHMLKICDIL